MEQFRLHSVIKKCSAHDIILFVNNKSILLEFRIWSSKINGAFEQIIIDPLASHTHIFQELRDCMLTDCYR